MADPAVQLKVAYLGGGSRNWARVLMRDLACCPELGGELRLFDIDFAAAKVNEELGNWLQEQPGVVSHWHYRAVEKIETALAGADFVFVSIQPGSLDDMEHEIGVAEKYGLFFPVGDTTGTPGLMRSLRAAITFSGFAQAIAEHCPQAWVINYTNPMSVCTRTLTKVAPGLKVFGCCHEVFSSQHILAELAQAYLGLEKLPARDEIRVNVNGINHFTWIDRADYRGHDLLVILSEHIHKPGVQRPFNRQEVEARADWFYDNRQIKYALFERYGIMAAAGDRHLAEFVPGFTHSPEVLFRWGVIRTPVSYRKGVWEQSSRFARDMMDGKIKVNLNSSGEEAVRQIKALVGLGDFVTNVNFRNQGQATNLPDGAVVETNAYFSQNRVQPLTAGELRPGVQALVARHIADQEMIIQAALGRDKDLAFQAVFNDPTTNLPIDRAWEMFEEIGLPANWHVLPC